MYADGTGLSNLYNWCIQSWLIFSQLLYKCCEIDIEAGVQATVQQIQEQQAADQGEDDDGEEEDTDDDEDTSDQLVQFM